ncbi:hypothetical protein V8G54_007183 [Vigna mungo]|uniref:Uncharacterized protein n=1 Tax=Vigna mungo TaxID=3915 RepID=A0AAQ3S8Q9_VIGMU
MRLSKRKKPWKHEGCGHERRSNEVLPWLEVLPWFEVLPWLKALGLCQYGVVIVICKVTNGGPSKINIGPLTRAMSKRIQEEEGNINKEEEPSLCNSRRLPRKHRTKEDKVEKNTAGAQRPLPAAQRQQHQIHLLHRVAELATVACTPSFLSCVASSARLFYTFSSLLGTFWNIVFRVQTLCAYSAHSPLASFPLGRLSELENPYFFHTPSLKPSSNTFRACCCTFIPLPSLDLEADASIIWHQEPAVPVTLQELTHGLVYLAVVCDFFFRRFRFQQASSNRVAS